MSERPELSRRTVLGWIVLVLAAVVGVSIIVGFVGPQPGFQWELASIFGTALGTTLLAASTGALAYSTWSDVRATWQLADLTKRDQDERERPIILQQDAAFESINDFEGALRVTLRNVGLGPALRVEVTADYEDEWGNEPTISSQVLPAIPAGDTALLDLFVDFKPKLTNEVLPYGFRLRGTYTDRSQRGSYEIITDWER